VGADGYVTVASEAATDPFECSQFMEDVGVVEGEGAESQVGADGDATAASEAPTEYFTVQGTSVQHYPRFKNTFTETILAINDSFSHSSTLSPRQWLEQMVAKILQFCFDGVPSHHITALCISVKDDPRPTWVSPRRMSDMNSGCHAAF